MLNLLKQLCALSGVSSWEDEVRDFIRDQAQPYADNIRTDAIGNLIVFKKGKKPTGNKLLLSAHMDEVGLMVKKIEDDGTLRFSSVGGIDRRVLLGKRVFVGEKRIPAVVGSKPIHLTTKEDRKSVPKLDQLYLDIGAENREEAEQLVSLGDVAAFDPEWMEFGNGMLKAKAIDDRVGCAILLELLKEDLPLDVTFAFTVQEEVGCRGAVTAAQAISPDIGISIDVTPDHAYPSDLEGANAVGAGVGVFVGGSYNGHAGTLGAWELPEDMTAGTLEMPLYDAREGNAKVRACIFCGDVLQQHIGNMNKTTEFARGLDFIVTIDPYFTEGAKWADVILPATTRFENDAEVGSVKIGYSNIVLQNKIIEPLFEARTDFWIGKEIAKRFGKDQYLPATSEEWVAKVLSSSEDPYVSALTIDKINAANGVYPLEGIEEPRREFMDRVFATPSTRMDVYYDALVEYGQALPAYEPPLEAHAGNKLAETYPLQLANVRTRYRIHNQFNDAKWIQQFAEPRIELNPSEMEKRGLATGDAVEVFNDRGSFKCRVKANESIRPGSARMFEGQTADFLIEGNVQNVTNDGYVERGAELMCGPVIPFSDTLVEIKKA